MNTMKSILCSVAPITAALSMQASGAIIIQDDFSGSSATILSGQTADVGGQWSADSLFKADGSFTTTTNTDRSASIALPSSLQLNTIYTLAVTLQSQANNFFYVGLQGAAPATGSAVQGQYSGSLMMEFDTIGETTASLHTYTGTENRYYTGAYNSNLSLVINTGNDLSAANVEFFINGVSQGSIIYDVDGLNTLVMGVEVPFTAGTKSVDIGSVTFSSEAIPEPSTSALFGLAGMAFILRRRR